MRQLVSRWYRSFRRYARTKDAINLLLAVIACYLGFLASDNSSGWAIFLTAIYIAFVIVIGWLEFSERSAKDRLEGEIIAGLFHLLNSEIFGGCAKTRFTLFRESPSGKPFIVPWYRYRKGGGCPITEAELSSAKFRFGEGLTGRSWENAGDSQVVFAEMPEFTSREEFEKHYVGELGVDQDTARSLSDYMRNVRAFFSFGYVDERGRFLGVLSVDIQQEIVLNENAKAWTFSPGNGKTKEITSQQLYLLSETIRNVLRSISVVQGGMK